MPDDPIILLPGTAPRPRLSLDLDAIGHRIDIARNAPDRATRNAARATLAHDAEMLQAATTSLLLAHQQDRTDVEGMRRLIGLILAASGGTFLIPHETAATWTPTGGWGVQVTHEGILIEHFTDEPTAPDAPEATL